MAKNAVLTASKATARKVTALGAEAPMLTQENQQALKRLKAEINRQVKVIDQMKRNLKAFKATLENKPRRTPEENAQLDDIMVGIGHLNITRILLGDARLDAIEKIVDLPGLLKKLGAISDKMVSEAKKMKGTAAVFKTVIKMVMLANETTGQLQRWS